MSFNFNQISKLVKIANSIKNPQQAIPMLLGQIKQKNPTLANNLSQIISSGKNPSEFLKEQASQGTITMENLNDIKEAYNLAQKFGLTHKIPNQTWNELENSIKQGNNKQNSFNINNFKGF